MGLWSDGQTMVMNTRHQIWPVWKPRWLSRLAPEDRCHLNGLAFAGGRPAFVTAVSRSDVADGWRDDRQHGGVVVDVANHEIVAEGLSMPHSPRVHDGKLWLLEAGTGHLGFIDRAHGRFERVASSTTWCRSAASNAR